MEAIVRRWHDVVNGKDLAAVADVVTDPVVVSGPRGDGPIARQEFGEWIQRSGIELRPIAWHPVDDRVIVVEQEARWPQSTEPARVATLFEVSEGRVAAARRFDDLRAALEAAR